MLKALEVRGKLLLGVLAAALFWRPGRSRRRAPEALRRVLLVRLDRRVGEVVLMTPVVRAARALPGSPTVDVLVHPSMAALMAWCPEVDRVVAAPRSIRGLGLFSRSLRALRAERYDAVINCSNWEAPSIGPALVCRFVAKDALLVGPAVWPVRWLNDLSVSPLPEVRSEARQRMHLLSALGPQGDQARVSLPAPAPDATVQQLLGALPRPFAVVNPGGRLAERRVPAQTFGALARTLLQAGVTPVVTWGPGEEALADEVVREAGPGCVLAPPTSLAQWSALVAAAQLVVCNNTGPMHLGVALGTPTFALFWRMDVQRWGHPHPPHRMVDLSAGESQLEATLEDFLRTLPGAQSSRKV